MTFQFSWHYLVLETHLLSSVYFLLSTVYCLLSNIYCLQSTVYWLAMSYSYFNCLAIPRASSVDFDIPSQGVQPMNDKQTITQIWACPDFGFDWLNLEIWKWAIVHLIQGYTTPVQFSPYNNIENYQLTGQLRDVFKKIAASRALTSCSAHQTTEV